MALGVRKLQLVDFHRITNHSTLDENKTLSLNQFGVVYIRVKLDLRTVKLAVIKVMIEEGPKEGSPDKVGWTLVHVCKAGEELKRAELTAKRAVVGAGARVLFYPTLLYNVLRNKLQSEFRWWDQIDQVCPSSERKRVFLVWHYCWPI